MNNLERLIDELCSNGVDYVKLGDFATIRRGGSFQKKNFTETGKPCIHYGQIYTKYNLFADKTVSFLSKDVFDKQVKAVTNDIIMAVTSENLEDVCKCVAWLGEEDVAVSGHTAIIHHEQNAKYLAYYFSSSLFFEDKAKLAHGAKVIEVKPDSLKDIKVPLPPIPVQEEIVRILDIFTARTADLTAKLISEHTARKQQYEHYRDHLLTFENDVPKKKFGLLATIVRGASPRPIKNYITTEDDSVCWIKIGDVDIGSKYITKTRERITKEGAKHSRYVNAGDFVLSNSMSFGRPYILAIDGCIHDGWLAISEFEENFTPDFLYHLISSTGVQKTMAQRASFGGAVQNLNSDIVRGLEFPVPPIHLQQKIAEILDKYDCCCNEINESIAEEIKARQHQYEYYRDKLLSFKEKEVSVNEQL